MSFMIRLSKRAWNNVIIFAMLIMILMFNMTNNILTGSVDSETEIALLPEGAVLMTLEFGPEKIERIGKGWRSTQLQLSELELEQIVQYWQNARMIVSNPFDTQNALIAVAWLAGEDKGRVYQFVESAEGLNLFVDGQYFKLVNLSLEQLILPGVL